VLLIIQILLDLLYANKKKILLYIYRSFLLLTNTRYMLVILYVYVLFLLKNSCSNWIIAIMGRSDNFYKNKNQLRLCVPTDHSLKCRSCKQIGHIFKRKKHIRSIKSQNL